MVSGAGLEGMTCYCTHDELLSTVAISDSTGTVIERSSYSAYGKYVAWNQDGSAKDATFFPFMFTGRSADSETGLYFYRARSFDGSLGRFISRDPIGYWDGSNPYSYVSNDPLNLVDPHGLCKCGVDITKPLGDVIENLWKAIKKSHDAGKEDQIRRACENLTEIPHGAYAWDIYALHDAGSSGKTDSDAFVDGDCGGAPCAGTVTVAGSCYWAAEVNYYLFGAARRACATYLRVEKPEGFEEHPWLTGSKGLVRIWRTPRIYRYITDPIWGRDRRGGGMGIPGRLCWLEAGWYGDFSKASSCSIPTCPACPKAFKGVLSGYIGGFTHRIYF